jgi:hypothetical protein
MMKSVITGYNYLSEYDETFYENKLENEDEKIESILEQSSYKVYKSY